MPDAIVRVVNDRPIVKIITQHTSVAVVGSALLFGLMAQTTARVEAAEISQQATNAAMVSAQAADASARAAQTQAESAAVAAAGAASVVTGAADVITGVIDEAAGSAAAAHASALVAQAARDDATQTASAIASTASAVEIRSTEAETAAAASEASRLAAVTARSEAEAARNTAIAARDTADTSASTAYTQAGLATQAAMAAGGSATAAASDRAIAQSTATAAGNSALASQASRLAAESARDSALGSAEAASTHSSSASTSASASQLSASGAEASRLGAVTARGGAEAARDQSVSSRDTAAGHAAQASSSADLSAGSAYGSGLSASAAFQSAQEAASSAGLSGSSASASDTARIAAQTARGGAEAARDASVTARDAAGAHASSAAAQASLAAASQTEAANRAYAASLSSESAATYASQAGQRADAAEGSRVLAETARGQAQASAASAAGSESTAYGWAGQAYSHAVVSAGYRDEAAQHRDNAAGYRDQAYGSASASAASASAASASQTAAGQQADSASHWANDAYTYASNAFNYRDSAASSSSSAAGAASQANASAVLAANIGTGAMNAEPSFASTHASFTQPVGWVDWSGGWNHEVVAGQVSPTGLRYGMNADGNVGISTMTRQHGRPGWYVMEATVTLDGGQFYGAGVLVQCFDDAGGYVGVDDTSLHFGSEPDISGSPQGAGSPGKTYRFSKLFRVNVQNFGLFRIYAMTGWSGMGGMGNAAKVVTWHECLVRPADAAEVETGVARNGWGSVGARIGAEENARASETASLASRASTTEARAVTFPNLLKNSDFSAGLRGWTGGEGWGVSYNPNIGNYIARYAWDTGHVYLTSDFIPIYGAQPYSLSFNGDGGSGIGPGNDGTAVYCSQYDADHGYLPDGDGYLYTPVNSRDWSIRQGTTGVSHPNAAYVRMAIRKGPATDGLGVSRIMLNSGNTQIAWSDQASVRDLAARTSITESSVADAQAKLSVARLVLLADAGSGRPARVAIQDGNGSSFIALDAAKIYFGDNTIFDDASDTLQTVTGPIRRVIAWGAPFGPEGLFEWVGDSSLGLSSMGRGNAQYYMASSSPYIGGNALAVSAGTSAGTKTTGTVSVGPNGGSTFLDFANVAAGGLWSFVIYGTGGGVLSFDGYFSIYEQGTSDAGTAETMVGSGSWGKSGGEPAYFDAADGIVAGSGPRRVRLILNNYSGTGGTVGLRFRADYFPPAA